MGNKVLPTGSLFINLCELNDHQHELMIYRERVALSHDPNCKPSVKIMKNRNWQGGEPHFRHSHYDKKPLQKIQINGPFPAWEVIAKEIQAVFGSQRLLLGLTIDIGKKRRWTNKAAMDVFNKIREARAAAKEAANDVTRKFWEKLERLYLLDYGLFLA